MKDLHSVSNSWQTPQDLFDKLNQEFNFDIDLCATKENSKCPWWPDNYLTWDIRDPYIEAETAFMNPPYSNPKPFIEKAWEDSKHCTIVLLVKVDPSTKWWSTFWDYNIACPYCDRHPENKSCRKCDGYHIYNGAKPGCQVRFLPKRIQFDPPKEMNAWKEKVKCTACKGHGHHWYWDIKENNFINCTKCNGTGEIEGNKWYVKCDQCNGSGSDARNPNSWMCWSCKGTGKKALSGPTFPSCILVFDRRGE